MEPAALEILSKDYLSNGASQVVVYGSHVAIPGAIAVFALIAVVIAFSRARRANAQFRGPPPRVPGRAAVRGRLELASGSSLAVRVSIEQVGTERRVRNTWKHEWREVRRRVDAAPFYLHDERGERLRVEPDDGVLLLAEPSKTNPGAGRTRTRVVELTPGEEVCAIGALLPGHDPEAQGGYRDPRGVLVLRRPSPREPLVLSSGPLGRHLHERAGLHLAALVVTVGFIVVFLLADLGFHVRSLAGEATLGQVTRLEPAGGKNGECTLSIRAPDGDAFDEDVSYEWCSALPPGAQVPIVHVSGWSFFSQVGRGAGVHRASMITGTFFLGFVVVFYALGWLRTKPWWQTKLVEAGLGRLPTT